MNLPRKKWIRAWHYCKWILVAFSALSDFIEDVFYIVDILSTILRNSLEQINELEPILLFFFKHLFSNQTNQNVIKQPLVWFLFYNNSTPSSSHIQWIKEIGVFLMFLTSCQRIVLFPALFVTILLSIFVYFLLFPALCNPSPLNICVFVYL